MALRDIFVGQELPYDYGVRNKEWMKSRKNISEVGQTVKGNSSRVKVKEPGETK